MQIRLSVPAGVPIPSSGTLIPFHIGARHGIATVGGHDTIAGHPVIEVVVPDWVADHLDHNGRGVSAEPVATVQANGRGRAKWHQTRTARGALPASAYL